MQRYTKNKAETLKQKERWLEQNSEVISEHNESVSKHGTFSEMIGQLDDWTAYGF